MQIPLEISLRRLELDSGTDRLIRQRTGKLHRFCSDIVSCRVAVEQPQRNHHTGNSLRARLEVRLPRGKDLVTTKDSATDGLPDDLDTIIRKTFDTMERKLRRVVEKRRGHVKRHTGSTDGPKKLASE
jgi:ribosome-associated translation inhibitor RaiA